MKRLSMEYKIAIVGVILSIISVFTINDFLNGKSYQYEPMVVKEKTELKDVIADEAKATSTTTTKPKENKIPGISNGQLFSLGSEVLFDNLTKDELVARLNKNLYDT